MRLTLFFDFLKKFFFKFFDFLIVKNSVRQFGATTLTNAKVPAVSPSFAFELLAKCQYSKKGNAVLVLLWI